MDAENYRQPLVIRPNPEVSASKARDITRRSLEEKLKGLEPAEKIEELRAYHEVIVGKTAELMEDPAMDSAARTALSGLVVTFHKHSTRLESKRLNDRRI